METLNFGILSTASVNDYSFLPVIKKVAGAKLVAIASRDMKKAKQYAKKHGISRAYGDYDSMLADPGIDCVYNPLPISMHMEWSIKALEAGKHVLCEKPIAASEAEARAIADKVAETGKIFAEAFHYRYHPLAGRVEQLVRSGEIGAVKKIESAFGVPIPDKSKVQFRPDLAGGALLDIGCYPVSFARWIADCDEAAVTRVECDRTASGVDGSMRATLEFANGIVADIDCSLVKLIPMYARIIGSEGAIFVLQPFTPVYEPGPLHLSVYLLLVRRGMNVRSIRVPSVLTYQCQLEAFRDAVRTGAQPATTAEQGVANMHLIDAIYAKSGIRDKVIQERISRIHSPARRRKF
jgi:predicted dehydrogenase